MIELNKYSTAVFLFINEFYEWAEHKGYQNPCLWKRCLSVESEAEFNGKKVPCRKMAKNDEPSPSNEEYDDWYRLRELFVATMLYEECGWDEFRKYLNDCDDWVKNEVKDWRPCDAAGGQYRIEDYLEI